MPQDSLDAPCVVSKLRSFRVRLSLAYLSSSRRADGDPRERLPSPPHASAPAARNCAAPRRSCKPLRSTMSEQAAREQEAEKMLRQAASAPEALRVIEQHHKIFGPGTGGVALM